MMNNNLAPADEHDTVFAELSWYANGTLPDSLVDRVDQHLVHCAICQNELHLLRKTYESVTVDTTTHEQVDRSFARVSQRIDTYEAQLRTAGGTADHSKSPKSGPFTQWAERFRQMIPGSGSSWFPAAASLAAVALVSVLAVQMLWAPAGDHYSVLTSDDAASLSLRLRFKETVRPAVVIRMVQEMGISASVQAVDEQVYLVNLRADAAFPDLNKAFEQFNSNPDIQNVEAVLSPAK